MAAQGRGAVAAVGTPFPETLYWVVTGQGGFRLEPPDGELRMAPGIDAETNRKEEWRTGGHRRGT